MSFRINDIVRIYRVPHSMHKVVQAMLGQTGFIEDIQLDRRLALFQGLELPGRPTNHTTWIPIFCLERLDDPAWPAAVTEHRRWFAALVREHEVRKQRW